MVIETFKDRRADSTYVSQVRFVKIRVLDQIKLTQPLQYLSIPSTLPCYRGLDVGMRGKKSRRSETRDLTC